MIDALASYASASTSPTLFGLQEVLDNQLGDILSGLGSSWSHIGFGRDDGKEDGEYSPIIYRSDVLDVVYSEMKWLSTTPDVVSFGWGAGSRRVVTIGVFQEKASGKKFIVANTHLDNVSSQARSEGIKVVVARIQAVQALYGPLAVMLTGDFNSEPNGDAYATLQATGYMTEIWDSGAVRLGSNQLTYTGFTATGISRIDFVWLGIKGAGTVTGTQFEIMSNQHDSMIISDHRAVVADVVVV